METKRNNRSITERQRIASVLRYLTANCLVFSEGIADKNSSDFEVYKFFPLLTRIFFFKFFGYIPSKENVTIEKKIRQ